MRTLRSIVALGLLCVVAQAADSPFSGTWKLSLTKSKLAPGNPTKSDIAQIAVDDSSFKIREEFTPNDGQPFVMKWDAKFDGKDYPVEGYPSADTVVLRRKGNKILGTMKKAGNVVSTWHAAVSKDGQVTTVNSVDTTQNNTKEVLIYEKQAN
jgi:hypothetical protein